MFRQTLAPLLNHSYVMSVLIFFSFLLKWACFYVPFLFSGLVKRIYTQKTEPSEKKVYKKNFDVPRQKPSDGKALQITH
jgi:hypothetical protein